MSRVRSAELSSANPWSSILCIMHRRDFLGLAAAAPIAAARVASPVIQTASAPSLRESWWQTLGRVADPVLSNLAQGTLRANMPVEQADGADRRAVTHLEAFGRLIAGMSPWLELSSVSGAERQAQSRYRALTQQSLANAVDPASPDALNFTRESQPLVDAAFLAQGLLRAPLTLAGAMDQTTRKRLIEALTSTRAISPGFSNWLMFSATVEAGLKLLSAAWDRLRVDYALARVERAGVSDRSRDLELRRRPAAIARPPAFVGSLLRARVRDVLHRLDLELRIGSGSGRGSRGWRR
jgi:hypothetical protein